MSQAWIVSVNTSAERGQPKRAVPEAQVNELGLVGDAHSGRSARQVSLLSIELINAFSSEIGREMRPGEFAENITTEGLDLRTLGYLDRLQVGGAVLEVTQFGKECHGDACAVFREVGKCVMPSEGVFGRVVGGGRVKPGDAVVHSPRPLRCRVITLSERASRGEYRDRSGERAEELVREFFKGRRWHLELERVVMGDDAARLEAELRQDRERGVDLVVTTGGTGVGPQDITPDVVLRLADKTIPGIMEAVRVKFGSVNPRALLSRSVAAVLGQMVVFALPGSPRAVEEYLGEILPILEHLVFMVRGLDVH